MPWKVALMRRRFCYRTSSTPPLHPPPTPHMEEFEEYAEKAKTLPDTTTNESKLSLYSLYKQATVGPVNTGIFTFYAPFLSFPYY
ncbi:hypothetical protein ZWY2020_039424 [Hordeum vulgare]|nr:hypothetical protein ZWY2020_039424 [Hordeum vulgare]